MNPRTIGAFMALAWIVAVSSCGGPTFVDKTKGETTFANPFSQVVFQVHKTYSSDPPECVAVLPFGAPGGKASTSERISFNQAEAVRRAFYAQLAPQGKRDVEIPRVGYVLDQLPKDDRADFRVVGEKLGCDALVVGEVTEYGSQFFGIYSRVAVGADLKMIRAGNNDVLWEGRHVAESHGGEVPLSPIGLAVGILKAAVNLDEEQVFRVIDDLTRRLVSTIPDNRIAVLEEPLSPVQIAGPKKTRSAETVEAFLEELMDRPTEERRSALLAAILAERFSDKDVRKLHEALIELAPKEAENYARYASYLVDQGDYDAALTNADRSIELNRNDHATHFLKGRILIKLDKLSGADSAIVQAIALDNSNKQYFNGLGYVNSLRGDHDRALAAYRMALERDPLNGFAHYNSGVTLYNLGDQEGAADFFYQAGLAYYKTRNYGQVEKALADLVDLTADGLDLRSEIKTLEQALEALTKGAKRDVKS